MRNALYQGNATKLINRLAEKEVFVEATEGSIPDNHMKDRYLVLRFTAFYLWQQHITIDPDTHEPLDYRSNVEDFLGKTMRFPVYTCHGACYTTASVRRLQAAFVTRQETADKHGFL